MYTFSGVMYIAFYETFFMNPMYIFPFVMVGVEKLLKENKPIVYIISLSYMFINYFYFAYMTAILVVIYYILSFIFDKDIENKSLKNFFKTGIKFFLYSLLAMGISALFLLPILLVITKIGRLDINYYLPVLYEKWYYKCFIAGMADSFYMPRNCFTKKEKYKIKSRIYFSYNSDFVFHLLEKFLMVLVIMLINGFGLTL